MGQFHARWRRRVLPILLGAIASSPAHAQDDSKSVEALELPTIDVVGTTLLPGLGTSIKAVPANVQTYTEIDLDKQRHTNLAEFLEQNATSVTSNAAQGNAFQPDISFRGFTASPLLGLPQGLSVFQDGVRINESFGDVVNWDLIPQSAIASIQLIPGSNPTFGLNTLGGALAIYTKSGNDHPGGSVQVTGGSFGRKAVEFEQGGKRGPWDYFFTGNLLRDRGWAEHNPSRVAQFFSKVGYQTKQTDVDLSLTLADNSLQGTQTLPTSLASNIRQAYTYPDRTNNQLSFMTLKGSHFLRDDFFIGGNLYYRGYRSSSLSSNLNGNFGHIDPDTGMTDTLQATNDQASIDQTGYGFGLQATSLAPLFSKKNQFVIGVSADLGRAGFIQQSQAAQLTADRGTDPLGPFNPVTDALTRNRYYGVFATDTLSLDPQWTLTLSGRSNIARISIADRSGQAAGLNSQSTYTRFNPAVGLNFNPTPQLTTYASYNEGMRAPTPIELTCADPAAPCKLPNNFLSDPPLKKVVSKTLEFGARGKVGEHDKWSVAVYRTELNDDIAFISSQGVGSNTGYFQNVGDTRRLGLELSGSTKRGALSASAHYSYIDATYQSSFAENSRSNSSADASGAIQVRPGNHIAGIPRHNLKVRLDYAFDERLTLGGNLLLAGATTARGDENNRDLHGTVPGYAIVNLDGRYQQNNDVELFARVNNLFNRQYANFGTLGRNAFAGAGQGFDPFNAMSEQFRGYGAPRGVWIGMRLSWQ